jgi:ubiquinone/menaquinone biosynthesis C-methylase UbiE
VLDVGCGTGIDYMGFFMNFMDYVGVDITPKFVARFKELHPEADVRVHSSLSLPFSDRSFDVVYSGGVIQHQHPDDYPRAIQGMWRICRNGLILTTSNSFTKKKDVIRLVRKKKVFDNYYGMPGFLEIIHALPEFKTAEFHKNIKHVDGDPYTVVVIMKEGERS